MPMKQWHQHLDQTEDMEKVRKFSEICQVEIRQPTRVMEDSDRVLRRTEDVQLARHSAKAIATEVLDRVQELKFFGDRSVKTPPELERQWTAWWTTAPETQAVESERSLVLYDFVAKDILQIRGNLKAVCAVFFKYPCNNRHFIYDENGRIVVQGYDFIEATQTETMEINAIYRNRNNP